MVSDSLKINTKKLDSKTKSSACTEELQAFFACFAKAGNAFDERCAAQKRALSECATMAARKKKVGSTINYHLRRLSRKLG